MNRFVGYALRTVFKNWEKVRIAYPTCIAVKQAEALP